MNIGINASFLRKQNTGIGQVTVNFLKKLADIEREKDAVKRNEFFLYLEEDVDLALPENFHKIVILPRYKRDDIFRAILWQKYVLPKRAKQDGCKVFLSLYQSASIFPKSVKHIMVVHDIILELFPEYLNNARKKIFWMLTKRAVHAADKILVVSHRTEKDLIQKLHVPAEKITVTYIDVDPLYKTITDEVQCAKVLKKYRLKPGYIYYGGGLEVRKNASSVIGAYKKLLDASKDKKNFPKLVISGKLLPQLAPLVTDVEEIVDELKIKRHVKLLDFVPQNDVPSLYRSAVLFVFPSKYEGFGLPILEAMNQGAPVITAKTSSLPEVGGDAVLYCDPNDEDDLAMVMRNVLSSDHLKAALSLKGRERAQHFSWKTFVEKIMHEFYC